MPPSMTTQLDPIEVMYLHDYDTPNPDAFTELEDVVGRRGRRFYGVFDQRAASYRACVRRGEQDDPGSLGLTAAVIGGGLYACERLRGEHEALVASIGPTFEKLSRRYSVDPARPSIEFYRRSDEFVLYLPIVG